ncbi:hypothetical protein V1525DRAFT_390761 [Lipomyces kononenkoae]|uniref:Uncharacterized protein n=1 Tax=Lipomyces kononenkoae TaxID=34357 RepID=A0ACC3STZ9_LIPKO
MGIPYVEKALLEPVVGPGEHGSSRRVILEAYRRQDEDFSPDTYWSRHKFLRLWKTMNTLAINISPNLRALVLED